MPSGDTRRSFLRYQFHLTLHWHVDERSHITNHKISKSNNLLFQTPLEKFLSRAHDCLSMSLGGYSLATCSCIFFEPHPWELFLYTYIFLHDVTSCIWPFYYDTSTFFWQLVRSLCTSIVLQIFNKFSKFYWKQITQRSMLLYRASYQ